MIIIDLIIIIVLCTYYFIFMLKRLDEQDLIISELYKLVTDSEEKFKSKANFKESLKQIIKKSPLNPKKSVFIPSKDVDYVMSGKVSEMFDGEDDDMFS